MLRVLPPVSADWWWQLSHNRFIATDLLHTFFNKCFLYITNIWLKLFMCYIVWFNNTEVEQKDFHWTRSFYNPLDILCWGISTYCMILYSHWRQTVNICVLCLSHVLYSHWSLLNKFGKLLLIKAGDQYWWLTQESFQQRWFPLMMVDKGKLLSGKLVTS